MSGTRSVGATAASASALVSCRVSSMRRIRAFSCTKEHAQVSCPPAPFSQLVTLTPRSRARLRAGVCGVSRAGSTCRPLRTHHLDAGGGRRVESLLAVEHDAELQHRLGGVVAAEVHLIGGVM